MSKVSVIIPVYNVEQYLKECLDSVVKQTLQDIEIICVNDGSVDNSLEILNEYVEKDGRFTVVSQQNSGLAPSRNAGLELAKGDYIFFLDSDDFLVDEFVLESLYNKIVNKDLDFLFSNCKMFADEDNEEIIKRIKGLELFFTYDEKQDYQVSLDNYQYIIDTYPCVSWGCLYRREFIVKHNIWFINQNAIHEDNGFFLKVMSVFPKVSFLNDTSVAYRIRCGSITISTANQKQFRQENEKVVVNDAMQYICENFDNKTAKALIKRIKSCDRYCRLFTTEIKGIFTYIWGVKAKKIVVLGIPLFREVHRGEKRIFKILGIPVCVLDKFSYNDAQTLAAVEREREREREREKEFSLRILQFV